ncbi:MAG: HAMP domain-containing sensor histidine kinase [Anaerocolumna aminovalerica]|uniref:HAMP domain-containing sensor histidine kinase n=1 Tax=Anaerocolumna aminovalerica TaxID=1527 RepID=UPI00291374D1|nr:HAMP domain-containing sensor histidine kinase [Anaerocolumna aminovalerica]MDU6265253.1 HAMP domain-containing sensor histidine kinase [Anaerocolumna aminovalerica]
MKIFPKTFLYTLALLVLIAGIASGLIYKLMPGVYTKQKQDDLTTKTDQLVKQLEAGKREDIVGLMGSFAAYTQSNVTINIGEDEYSLIMYSNAAESEENVTSYVTITSNTVSEKSDSITMAFIDYDSQSKDLETSEGVIVSAPGSFSDPEETMQHSFTMDGELGTLTVSMTFAPVEEAVGAIVSLLPISILLCVVIAILFSLLYAHAMTKPIKAISDETRHMTLLERNARCKIKSKDEFGELAANVNGLYENLLSTIDSLEAELKKVAVAEKAKTDFLRAASHELKTPATAVSVIIDNMILEIGKYKNHGEWLPKCKELVDNLSDKLRDILDASHLEDVAESWVTESLETLCSNVIEPYLIIARARGLSLYMDWSASFSVTAPPRLLSKALSNIFSNAVQYTAPGGKFSVYCKGRSLIVENECASITEDQLSRLYEPFYRPDASRSRETGGNGLGLYIVETILHRLELDYRFEPMKSPDGMRFTIFF